MARLINLRPYSGVKVIWNQGIMAHHSFSSPPGGSGGSTTINIVSSGGATAPSPVPAPPAAAAASAAGASGGIRADLAGMGPALPPGISGEVPAAVWQGPGQVGGRAPAPPPAERSPRLAAAADARQGSRAGPGGPEGGLRSVGPRAAWSAARRPGLSGGRGAGRSAGVREPSPKRRRQADVGGQRGPGGATWAEAVAGGLAGVSGALAGGGPRLALAVRRMADVAVETEPWGSFQPDAVLVVVAHWGAAERAWGIVTRVVGRPPVRAGRVPGVGGLAREAFWEESSGWGGGGVKLEGGAGRGDAALEGADALAV